MDEDRRLELTGEFLRMWQWCPLQAVLCRRYGRVPLAVMSRCCIRFAIGASVCVFKEGHSPTSAAERSKRTTEAVKNIRKDLKG